MAHIPEDGLLLLLWQRRLVFQEGIELIRLTGYIEVVGNGHGDLDGKIHRKAAQYQQHKDLNSSGQQLEGHGVFGNQIPLLIRLDDAGLVDQQIGADGIGEEHQIVQHQMESVDLRLDEHPQHRHQGHADDSHRQGNGPVDDLIVAHKSRQLLCVILRQWLIEGKDHHIRQAQLRQGQHIQNAGIQAIDAQIFFAQNPHKHGPGQKAKQGHHQLGRQAEAKIPQGIGQSGRIVFIHSFPPFLLIERKSARMQKTPSRLAGRFEWSC